MTNGTTQIERDVVRRYRVTGAKGFRLSGVDPGDTAGFDLGRQAARDLLRRGVERVAALQERLYAEDRRSLLVIFQAMDAAGKDGTIKHVLSGVNPQGVTVTSFRHPEATALAHDFLWRHVLALPERGRIGIHNRSWYEEVLTVRVHPEILHAQKLPPDRLGPKIFEERLQDIAAFERYLARQGTVILKFFLHLSPDEQRRRLLARIDEPDRNWKFDMGDLTERQRWGDYMAAYEAAVRATAAPHAPWYVVPADNKWFTRLVVAGAIGEALEALDLRFPVVDAETRAALMTARAVLDGTD